MLKYLNNNYIFAVKTGYFSIKIYKNRGGIKKQKIYERIGRLKEKYLGIANAYEIKIIEKKDKPIVEQITYVYNKNNASIEKTGTYFIRTSI